MTSPTPFPPGNSGGLPPGLTPGTPQPPSAPPNVPPGAPGAGWIPVGAGAPPVVPVAAAGGSGRRGRPALTVLGILLILGGVGAAIALIIAGNQRYSDGIERLARGPAGCVTTLDVDEDATYYFYVETKGEVGDVRGSCPATGEQFDGGRASDASISLKDDNGDTVRLRRAEGVSYDAGGFAGELVRSARLDAGSYSLAVEADDDVIVAVGRDVDGLKTNIVLPIIVGAAGLVLGLVLVLLGRRRRAPAAPAGGAPGPAAGPGASPAWGGFQPPSPGNA